MIDNYIQIKNNNIITIGIKDSDGKDTGERLYFDAEDVSLPLKYQECIELHKKNINNIKNQLIIIDKRQDHKGKKLLSANEEDKIKAIKGFYDKEIEALDLFLGKGGCKKLLNGREPYYTMFDDIADMIEPIMPIIEKGFKNIEKDIRKKYGNKESNVLKNE